MSEKPLQQPPVNTDDPTIDSSNAEIRTIEELLRRRPAEPSDVDRQECQRIIQMVDKIGSATSMGNQTVVQERSNQAPERIGQYELLAELGKGGMGTVYKARHTKLNKLVALKVLPENRLMDANAVGRFEREMQAVGQLSHVNIVTAHDAGHADNRHYLAMELVDGVDLSTLIRQIGPLPIAEACEIVRRAAEGLQHVHSFKMVHRDIKPGNLMLTHDGQVKILDMGLARFGGLREPSHGELTSDGQVMGTLDYMAPEQANNSHAVDIRADIFSLGATLFRLIVGRTPLDDPKSTSLVDKLMSLATAVPPAMNELRRDVPQGLSKLVARTLAKNPDERPATPQDLANLLDPYAQDARLEQLATISERGLDAATIDTSIPSLDCDVETKPDLAPSIPGKRPPRWMVAAIAGGAFAFSLLWGVIIIIRNREGQEIARIEVPDGHSVEIQTADTDRDSASLPVVKMASPEVAEEKSPAKVNEVVEKAASNRSAAPSSAMATPWLPNAEQQLFFEAVAQLSGEEQALAVARKLQEINSGYDGVVEHKLDESDRVIEFAAHHPEITSIWPVRALPELQVLILGADNSKLSDLTPLAGAKLVRLEVNGTQVADLSPLAGMPMEYLDCNWTKISDLSPIRGMPLTLLSFTGAPVSDLSPAEGMPLEFLECGGTRISDLSPVANSKLKLLNCGESLVTDLSPIEHLRLEGLVATVEDLTPLKDMQLRSLHMPNSKVSDLSPLSNMVALENADFQNTRVTDISPLQGIPLRYLSLSNTGITDISPLTGAPLIRLRLSESPVLDLSPLEGMPLEALYCDRTSVADYEVIKALGVKELSLTLPQFHNASESSVRDALAEQWFAGRQGAWNVLSHEEYWKGFKEEQLAAQNFADETGQLPAKEQYQKIRFRFEELMPGIPVKLVVEYRDDAIVKATVSLPEENYDFDLSPLRALPMLEELTIQGGSHWLDLSPVNTAPLKSLSCPDLIAQRNRLILKEIKTLETVNGKPVND